MENIIRIILSLIAPNHFLLLILLVVFMLTLGKKGSIKICFDLKKRKIKMLIQYHCK